MDCREARDFLNEELDGRLASGDAARLAGHVAGCAACARERRDLASLRATFRAIPRTSAPAGFKDGVMSSLPRGSVRVFPRVAGWIAAVAAVVVLTVTLVPRDRAPVERDVASAPAARDGEMRAESGARVPELAAKNAEPVAPPRPDAPLQSGAEVDTGFAGLGDAAPKEPAGGESADAKSRAARTETAARDEDDAARPAPAPGTPAEPAAPPVTAPADVVREGADRQVAGEIRYVVFTDAVAAQKFAAELAAAEAPRAKDKTKLDDAAKELAQGAAPSVGKTEAKKADGPQDLLKAAAFRTRRVISRTPLAQTPPEAELAARAAVASGALLPAADTARFTELLDEAAAAPEKEAAAADARERKAGPAASPAGGGAGGGKAAGRAAPRPVVVVIVVLGEPAKPAEEKR